MDAKFIRIRELITQQEEIEAELNNLVSGTTKERKPQTCAKCGQPGHSSRTCKAEPIA